MRQKSEKMKVKSSQSKKNVASCRIKKDAKKISLGQIVQKTVEILKKPFAGQSKPEEITSQEEIDKTESCCTGSTKAEKPKRKPRKRKEEEKQRLKQKTSRRKKEAIAVDYPESSLKRLEKDKEEKVAKRKPQTSRKQPPNGEVESIASPFQDDDQFEATEERQREVSSQISTEVNGFFYTNDKFINRFEDSEILKYLKSYYPMFMKDPSDFQTQKKQILDMLQNAEFMDQFLNYYDIDIYEFFKYLFRLEPDLFKGSFLKRVQKAMRYKQYAIKAKRCSFVERRRARLKNLKQRAIQSRKAQQPTSS